MKMKMIIGLTVSILLGLALLSGCGTREAPPAENPSVTGGGPPAAAPPSPEEGAPAFAGSIDALQSLSSYTYTTVMTFDGIEGGEAKSETLRITGEYVAPDRHHVLLTDSASGEAMEFIAIGTTLWVKSNGEWTEVPQAAGAPFMQSVFTYGLPYVWSKLATGLAGDVKLAGKEIVNGSVTFHYTSDYAGWEENAAVELADARADIWIAEEGYPIKFVFTASGKNEGSVRWETEMTSVNGSIVIAVPGE